MAQAGGVCSRARDPQSWASHWRARLSFRELARPAPENYGYYPRPLRPAHGRRTSDERRSGRLWDRLRAVCGRPAAVFDRTELPPAQHHIQTVRQHGPFRGSHPREPGERREPLEHRVLMDDPAANAIFDCGYSAGHDPVSSGRSRRVPPRKTAGSAPSRGAAKPSGKGGHCRGVSHPGASARPGPYPQDRAGRVRYPRARDRQG